MKRYLMYGITSLLITFSSFPALADNSNTISFYSDSSSVVVGTQTQLHLAPYSGASPELVIQTNLGSLQGYGTKTQLGNGSSITVSPNSDNSYPLVWITSPIAGVANLQVFENGLQIASTTITFIPSVQLTADSNSVPAGNATNLHMKLSPIMNPAPNLQIQTTLGTLNGSGSSIQEVPLDSVNDVYPNITLSSNQMGTATVTAYYNGAVVATSTVNFHSGPLSNVTVKASPPVINASTITITATDSNGNLVSDGTPGTTFNVSTDLGQFTPIAGLTTSTNGSNMNISTRSGVIELLLSSNTSGTANVTVSSTNTSQTGVVINGSSSNTVTIPVNLSNGTTGQPGGTSAGNSNLAINSFTDYTDVSGVSDRNSAIRELSYLGVLNGYPDHTFQPNSQIQRSEFAAILARYMGVSSSESALGGTMYMPFADVPKDVWYASAVVVDASLGYIKGDGVNYYPDHSITYAEVAQILLRNLGIQSEANFPDGPVTTAKQTGLFNGIGSFNENAPATRGDVAIIVRNALHAASPVNTSGSFNSTQPLEMKTLGYSYSGDNPQAVVNSIGTNSLTGNPTLMLTLGNQTMSVNLASSVVIAGGSTLNDLQNKKIHYLTNRLGLVSYIEIVS